MLYLCRTARATHTSQPPLPHLLSETTKLKSCPLASLPDWPAIPKKDGTEYLQMSFCSQSPRLKQLVSALQVFFFYGSLNLNGLPSNNSQEDGSIYEEKLQIFVKQKYFLYFSFNILLKIMFTLGLPTH